MEQLLVTEPKKRGRNIEDEKDEEGGEGGEGEEEGRKSEEEKREEEIKISEKEKNIRDSEVSPAQVHINELDELLNQFVIKIEDDDGDVIYVFNEKVYFNSVLREPLYAGLKDFLLLPYSSYTLDLILHTKFIGDKFGNLFREPSLKLLPSVGGGGGNNMPLISKYALELVLYLIDYVTKNPLNADKLVSRLDLFDNAVPFISSTLRQIVFWKKISLDKKDEEMLYALRLCKEIKDRFFTPSKGMIVVHFCVNKLLTLWVEITKRNYVKDSAVFHFDRRHWECDLDFSARHDSQIRLTRLKKSEDIQDFIDWIVYYCPPITPKLLPKCNYDGECWQQDSDHWKKFIHVEQSKPMKKPRLGFWGGSTRQSKRGTIHRRRRTFSARTAKRRRRYHTRRRHRH